MENSCAKISKIHMHGGVKPMECVIYGNEVDNHDMNLFSALNSSLEVVSDEEENFKETLGFPEPWISLMENVSIDINQERKALEAWARRPK